ncbi:MAG: tubulin-like doman-containing protein, partial [Verrucomicrobiales bacterium]
MKNHLFIGLGGQGGKSIAELRKVFDQRDEDAKSLYDAGHRWDFLYIDSSRDVTNNRQNWTHFGKNLSLDDSSFLYLKDDGQDLQVNALALKPDVSPWIGKTQLLEKFLEGNQGIQGANQRRRLGRLLFANNADNVQHAICDQKIGQLTTNGNQCAIHIFASLAGGTGSGSIVDLVTLLRTRYPNAAVGDGFPIFLYLYVTDEDFQEAQVGYFHQNQFSALRDLNALACGKLKPTLLGSSHAGERYTGAEPFTQILLSTGLNDRNSRIKLNKQHQIVAESAFERIFAYCSGHLDEESQRPLTGEDRQASYPGEPLGNLLRSFRFGSSGMRRWEVPTEEIHDLLANELYVSSFRQMLYQNWNDESGFLGERLPAAQSGQNDLVKSLDDTVSRALIENSRLAEIATAMEAELNAVHEGIKKEGFKDLDLDGYETRLKERYSTHVGGQGVDELFKAFAKTREESVTELISTIQDAIRGIWTRNSNPLGLSYVPDALLALQESIRNRSGGKNATGTDNSALRVRMEARKSEWAKMTALSRPFRQADLAGAHKRDLLNLLKSDLRSRAVQEDREILDRLAVHLGQLEGDFRQCVDKFEAWHSKTKGRRDELRLALRNLHEDDVANKCELSDEALESFIKTLRV